MASEAIDLEHPGNNGAALIRRARTRTRSRTVTSGSSSRFDRAPLKNDDEPPLPPLAYTKESLPTPKRGHSGSQPSQDSEHGRTELLTRSSRAAAADRRETKLSEDDSKGTVIPAFGNPSRSDDAVPAASTDSKHDDRARQSKSVRRGASLPRLETRHRRHPSFDLPAFKTVHNSLANMRDSLLTYQTKSSSSVYPPSTSTSTVSGSESLPSPRSSQIDLGHRVATFNPEDGDNDDVDGDVDLNDFDADDVSYRLRLLVKNNYFLPPAHSKPSPADLSPKVPVLPKKQSAPAFLDLFRVGKMKPKCTPEPSPNDRLAPVLRTTSDSTTASGYAPRPPVPRPVFASTPAVQLPIAAQERPGRVMVVRECMEDIVTAAKLAEQDIKVREARQESAPRPVVDQVIDPTDAVDLPPPPAGYPFAVQASVMQSLGVQDSIPASVLADRLAPPIFDPEEDAWRKAILHEAVNLSYNNTPMSSAESSSHATSSSLSSPSITSPSIPEHRRNPDAKPRMLLDQRIVPTPILEADEAPPSAARTSAGQTRSSKDSLARPFGRQGGFGFSPTRADSPPVPRTPLAPRPRRHIVNPVFSLSQTDLSNGTGGRTLSPAALQVLRRSVSSPLLREVYEPGLHDILTLTPPLAPTTASSVSHDAEDLISPDSHIRAKESLSIYSQSSAANEDTLVLEADAALGRPSMTLSLPTDGRPSMSIYSQPSPVASAFHDAWADDFQTAAESVAPHSAGESSRSSSVRRGSGAQRYSVVSPPPRVSSSLAHIALPPPPRPPRTSSLHHTVFFPSSSSVDSDEDDDDGMHTPDEEISVQLPAPSPTTPSFPGSARSRNSNPLGLTLHIPSGSVPAGIHSAPGPSSPTSFFDTLEAQSSNAMDDFDSDEEDPNEVYGGIMSEEEEPSASTHYVYPLVSPTAVSRKAFPNPSPRPSFMRLGNHSTPSIVAPIEGPIPINRRERQKPVTNVPTRARVLSFKLSRGRDRGTGLAPAPDPQSVLQGRHSSAEPASPPAFPDLDVREVAGRRRPATAGGENVRARALVPDESLRRFDGMLVQHMQAERDRMKKIASAVTPGRR